MKFILIVLLLLPSIVSGGNYQRIANGMRVIEVKEGNITVTERTPRFKNFITLFLPILPKRIPLIQPN